MKTTITSTYHLRGKPITSYHSFPQYSDKIEETMSKLLTFLKQYDTFSLEMRVSKNSS